MQSQFGQWSLTCLVLHHFAHCVILFGADGHCFGADGARSRCGCTPVPPHISHKAHEHWLQWVSACRLLHQGAHIAGSLAGHDDVEIELKESCPLIMAAGGGGVMGGDGGKQSEQLWQSHLVQ